MLHLLPPKFSLQQSSPPGLCSVYFEVFHPVVSCLARYFGEAAGANIRLVYIRLTRKGKTQRHTVTASFATFYIPNKFLY
jgi:hypothetical protein